jgi:hypothetical protein
MTFERKHISKSLVRHYIRPRTTFINWPSLEYIRSVFLEDEGVGKNQTDIRPTNIMPGFM